MCVCLSRVFIAAHFPHQVVAGVITGQWPSRDEYCLEKYNTSTNTSTDTKKVLHLIQFSANSFDSHYVHGALGVGKSIQLIEILHFYHAQLY